MPFDPRCRLPTWEVPLRQVSGAAAVLVVFCKGCQHRRRWPVSDLVARYGERRLVQDLWIRWRCSRWGSANCLSCPMND
jgi:RNase P subunit RPR2